MSLEDLGTSVSAAVLGTFANFITYLPAFIGGLIVLVIGLVVAAVAYRVIVGVLKAVQLERFLARYGISTIEGRSVEWTEILAELVRWAIIIVFLIPTLATWKLDAVNSVLSRVLLYIPNVIVAVVLAMVGLVFAKLAYRIAYNTSRSLGRDSAHAVGLVARWSLLVFVAFLVLHQLGVAQELLRILFAGVVAMLALAGGLAFGLGGQNAARTLLDSIWERFRK
ncbi:hypothetical protein HYW40_02035 [Candidatus Curtissbacteria bacterium]|nr:hypothetical protein [Candidatus Curtissbacteria bacterium]